MELVILNYQFYLDYLGFSGYQALFLFCFHFTFPAVFMKKQLIRWIEEKNAEEDPNVQSYLIYYPARYLLPV